jgi:putative ABC transport system substrate-binding protein
MGVDEAKVHALPCRTVNPGAPVHVALAVTDEGVGLVTPAASRPGHRAMARRTFIAGITLGVLTAPFAAQAKQPGKVPRIGILWPYSPAIAAPFAEALRQGLRDAGYVEGQNVALEERWADGALDRLPSLAADLVRLNVDLIVAASTPAVQATRHATRTISIVMTLVSDPVGSGIVASPGQPGGNVTGLSLMHPELSGKRLALLKEVIPNSSHVAVFWSASTPSYRLVLRETEAAARGLGVHLQVVEVRGPADLDTAFSAIARAGAGALIVLPDAMFRNQERQILDLAAKRRLPAMYWSRELVDAGGLMAYGANIPDMHRQAALFVAKILRGAKPTELPIEQPAKFELIINLKTARALGLAIPQSLLVRADQVIE